MKVESMKDVIAGCDFRIEVRNVLRPCPERLIAGRYLVFIMEKAGIKCNDFTPAFLFSTSAKNMHRNSVLLTKIRLYLP